jgi:exonuclease SbcC
MNIKLHSITITDFKGISGENTVDLESDVVFLGGPNGYGKTTIYDAIELCITGKILRIDQAKSGENAGKRHQRSILHNDPEKDIRIELDITSEGQRRTIKVVCPRAVSKQPFIDWTLFERKIYSHDGELVDGEHDINNWPNVSSENYKLFTYLQQSDSIFFLKLAQKDRHDILTPLIDAGGYEDERTKIDLFRRKLGSYKQHLTSKLKSLDVTSVQTSDKAIVHEQIIKGDVIQDYDEVNPFKSLTIEQAKVKRNEIVRRLDEVETFLDTFSPKEYVKSEQYKLLARFAKDKDFLNFLTLRNIKPQSDIVVDAKNRVKVRNFTKDSVILRKYVLRNELATDRFNELKVEADRFQYQSQAIFSSSNEQRPVDIILNYVSQDTSQFSLEVKSEALKYLTEYKPIAESVGTYGKLLTELQRLRNELTASSKSLHDHGHDFLNDSCPYCGTKWEDHQKLIASINEQTQSIESLKGESAKRLSKLEDEIRNDFIAKLLENLVSYRQSSLMFDQLKVTGLLSRIDLERNELIDQVFPDLNKLTQPITKWDSNVQIIESTNLVRAYIEENTSQDETSVVDLIDELYAKNYETELAVLSRLEFEIKAEHTLPAEKFPAMPQIVELQEHLSQLLGERAGSIQYNPSLVLPEYVDIYKRIFNRSEDNFEFAKPKIKNKLLYIEQEYSKIFIENRKSTQSKLDTITILQNNVSSLLESYNQVLKEYQQKITKDLQLPFYLYTSKILQNSPQCDGIFMHSQNDSKTIVFTTARGETLDAAHQLSSGQLVVVSMAFYLAMNTVYPQKSTKLMLIDDPIQDLDVLNIHSLTELLRRKFIGDYQLIMSTHNEFDINYMRYKFGTAISKDRINNIDVQELFFNTDLVTDEEIQS